MVLFKDLLQFIVDYFSSLALFDSLHSSSKNCLMRGVPTNFVDIIDAFDDHKLHSFWLPSDRSCCHFAFTHFNITDQNLAIDNYS
jgi:hypothetical protein